MIPRLEISAASTADFPHTGLPEIALVGRSNVGKSSLINALVRQKIARTSAAPGKTRLANFYLVEPPMPGSKLYLVDLPGYGYARGGAGSAETFETLTRQYFDPVASPKRRLAGTFHLIDARHPDIRQDAFAHEWLLRHELPMAVVATKMDKLSRHDQAQIQKLLTAKYGTLVLPVSAMKETGLRQVWLMLRDWTAQ